MSVHAKGVDDDEDTEVLQWNAIHLSVASFIFCASLLLALCPPLGSCRLESLLRLQVWFSLP